MERFEPINMESEQFDTQGIYGQKDNIGWFRGVKE